MKVSKAEKNCCNSPQRQILLEMQKGGAIPTLHSIPSQPIRHTLRPN